MQRSNALAVARRVLQLRIIRPQQNIAAYLPASAELDTRILLRALLARGCRLFLPRIDSWRAKRMRFLAVNSGPLRRNRFGIAEPSGHRSCGTRWMHIVLLPLVAYDSHGNRLGSGAGFYDRALRFRQLRSSWHGPLLLGLAHSAQYQTDITSGPYDVPIDAVVTEKGITWFNGRQREQP